MVMISAFGTERQTLAVIPAQCVPLPTGYPSTKHNKSATFSPFIPKQSAPPIPI